MDRDHTKEAKALGVAVARTWVRMFLACLWADKVIKPPPRLMGEKQSYGGEC